MFDDLTVYNLRDVPAEAARALALETLDRWPLLQTVYDGPFLEDLIRRRNSVNSLLLRLVQPHDMWKIVWWDEVVDDLTTLGGPDATAIFRDRRRLERLANIESWRTELRLPAWLRRSGIAITLAKPGVRGADFRTGTEPETYWEIKTPLDIERVRADDALTHELYERLGNMRQPFSLALEEFDLEFDAVPAAVETLKGQLLAYDQKGGSLPREFNVDGLVVTATGRDDSGQGGLGMSLGREYCFEDEHVELAAKQIRSAAAQLPAQGGGIVVIDTSNATWLDDTDVQDACYGAPGMRRSGTGIVTVRDGGVFRRGANTRISAVVAYSRNVVLSRHGHDIAMLHNPFARVPLPLDLFQFPDVRHGRVVASGSDFVYRLDEP
jgi:hypothetical protein